MLVRVKLIWEIVAVFACFVGGCTEKSSERASIGSAAPSSSSVVQPLDIGDMVIVESGSANFIEAKVVRVDGDRIGYEYGTRKTAGEAKLHSVMALREGRAAPVDGQRLICRTALQNWNCCVVKGLSGPKFMVEDEWGKPHTLELSDLVIAPPTIEKNIGIRLERAAKNRAFLEAVKASGKPYRPEGWKPRKGDLVIALFAGEAWYQAKVISVDDKKLRVLWEDQFSPSDRSYDEVAPRTGKRPSAVAESFVLVRPSSGTRWEPWRVESVAKKTLILVDREDRKKNVSPADVIPIVSSSGAN